MTRGSRGCKLQGFFFPLPSLVAFFPDFFFVFDRMRRIILPPPFYISELRNGEVLWYYWVNARFVCFSKSPSLKYQVILSFLIQETKLQKETNKQTEFLSGSVWEILKRDGKLWNGNPAPFDLHQGLLGPFGWLTRAMVKEWRKMEEQLRVTQCPFFKVKEKKLLLKL